MNALNSNKLNEELINRILVQLEGSPSTPLRMYVRTHSYLYFILSCTTYYDKF